jgi:phosphoribulokinase
MILHIHIHAISLQTLAFHKYPNMLIKKKKKKKKGLHTSYIHIQLLNL